MSIRKIVGIVLLVLGTLALVYRGFSYTKEKHDLNLGVAKFSLKEKERVEIPVWLGVALVAVGGGLLLFGERK